MSVTHAASHTEGVAHLARRHCSPRLCSSGVQAAVLALLAWAWRADGQLRQR